MWLVLLKFLKAKKQLQFWTQAGCKSDNFNKWGIQKALLRWPLEWRGGKKQMPCLYDV